MRTMKPTIYLIRHGESECNADKSILKTKPDYALRLTEKGKKQALEAGMKLKDMVGFGSYMVYASPYWRTRQTYQMAMKAFDSSIPHNYYEDPRIREQEWDTRIMKDENDEIENERDRYGHFYYRFLNGESCADVYNRVSDFINTLHRDFDKPGYPSNVFIFGHGMLIRIFLMRWFHWTVEDFEAVANPKNCVILKMEYDPDTLKYKLVTEMHRYADRRHDYQYDWSELL